ncbi:MAG: response regulator transcription factor [Egibacteraceae bacterium]
MRVLVVEDERRLAAAVRRGLEDHGFAVEVAHDGAAGFWLARHECFDAVVLDIQLPHMSGYEICKRLRAERVWTPILMLTAKDGEYDEADALDLGADDYLRKPFSYVVLIARLNALLRRGAPERPAQLRVGDLVLDPSRRTVKRGETPIELTRREFALLEYLMRNAGEPRSKHEILDHVWGADFDRGPNVVEVYVGYLRRKVDAPFGTRMIETVRNHGYRVTDE